VSCTSVENIQLETRRDGNHHDRLDKMNLVITLGPLAISIGNRLQGSCPVRALVATKVERAVACFGSSLLESMEDLVTMDLERVGLETNLD